MITIYHNPRCSKSRECLQALEASPEKITVVEYLKEPLNAIELKGLLKKLNMKAREVVRKKESLYIEKYKGKSLTETQWLNILAQNPILIERPILVKENKAIIGRPTERVKELL